MSKRSIYQFGKDAIEDAIVSIVGARKQITKNQNKGTTVSFNQTFYFPGLYGHVRVKDVLIENQNNKYIYSLIFETRDECLDFMRNVNAAIKDYDVEIKRVYVVDEWNPYGQPSYLTIGDKAFWISMETNKYQYKSDVKLRDEEMKAFYSFTSFDGVMIACDVVFQNNKGKISRGEKRDNNKEEDILCENINPIVEKLSHNPDVENWCKRIFAGFWPKIIDVEKSCISYTGNLIVFKQEGYPQVDKETQIALAQVINNYANSYYDLSFGIYEGRQVARLKKKEEQEMKNW